LLYRPPTTGAAQCFFTVLLPWPPTRVVLLHRPSCATSPATRHCASSSLASSEALLHLHRRRGTAPPLRLCFIFTGDEAPHCASSARNPRFSSWPWRPIPKTLTASTTALSQMMIHRKNPSATSTATIAAIVITTAVAAPSTKKMKSRKRRGSSGGGDQAASSCRL
ncbi:hypothetical protein SOVF_098610, partial [Spinacia oleracea]